MSVRAYRDYKGSGQEWLGAIPRSWSTRPVSSLFATVSSGTTPPTDASQYYAGDICWVTTGELRESVITDTEKHVSEEAVHDLSALKVYPPGTLLIALYGATIGRLGVLAVEACTNQACCAMAHPRDINVSFAFYCLIAARDYLVVIATGGGQPNINKDKIRSLRLPHPSLLEQSAIAAFLDRETGKIDALVAEQERLMALLKEKRQAVISQAVTKGLNPNAKMKPSGVEWLGEVPEHWEVRTISSLTTKITNGYVGPTRDILTDEGVRYLQSLHIKNNKIAFDVPYYVSQHWSLAHKKSILATGDVLVVQTGDIGQVAVVAEEFSGCNCHALIILAPVRPVLDGRWLSWVLNADYGRHSLLSIQTGALHPHLNCGDVKDVLVPIPPADEQRQIVSYIEGQLDSFNDLMSDTEHAITLLKERRAALISAAVTGKIDVRDLVNAQQDAA